MGENTFNGNGSDCCGGGGAGYDDTALKKRISSLEESQVEQDKLIAKNSSNINRIADKIGVNLSAEYLPLAQNQGVVMPDGVGIDTGLTINGNAIFRVTGCLKDSDHMACLIGARVGTSTAARTCINVLPKNRKIQSQWAGSVEVYIGEDGEDGGLDLLQPFEVIANKNKTVITQGNGDEFLTITNKGYSGSNTNVPICLFNQQIENAEYYSPVLQRAEIEIDGVKTVFEPMIKRDLETGAESVVLLKNGVEMAIDGLTLFEIQAI